MVRLHSLARNKTREWECRCAWYRRGLRDLVFGLLGKTQSLRWSLGGGRRQTPLTPIGNRRTPYSPQADHSGRSRPDRCECSCSSNKQTQRKGTKQTTNLRARPG
eukprot:1139365-Pelagomonas_calceolata.AAC.1